MPVSLGEWRVQIGRFIHWVREDVIRERKEKLLKERIRRLKLLQKRLLEKKEKSEDECESRPNDLSVKVDNTLNVSNIINNTTNDSHKEDSGTTQSESATNHKSNGTHSTFPIFFNLLPLFFLLVSLMFFFVVDFSDLLESSKPWLNWGGESTRRSTCFIIIIMCSSLAYVVLSYIKTNKEDLQDNQVLVRDEKATAESSTKANNTTTGSTFRLNIEENNTQSEATIKVNNTKTETSIGNNNTLNVSRLKEKNATIESTKECNNFPTNGTIKAKNTTTESTIRENSTLPESTIKDNIPPKECHIDTPSTIADKPSKRNTAKRKTLKSKRKTTIEKKGATKSTYKSSNTITESTIEANNSPIVSNINKDNNSPNGSAIKDNSKTESTMKASNTPSTIKDKSSKRKISMRKTAKDQNIATESHIEGTTTTIGSTIKGSNTTTKSAIKDIKSPTESTMKKNNFTAKSVNKGSNSTTECTITNSNTPTKSAIKDIKSPTESTMKKNKSTAKSVNKGRNPSSESTIKEKNNPTESTIKVHNTTAEGTVNSNNTTTESSIKDSNSTAGSIIKDCNTLIELGIKGNTKENDTQTESPTKGNNSSESPIKGNNSTSESAIKGNNSTSEYAIKDNNSTSESAIKDSNTPSSTGTPTEENNNQPMKVNIAQAEYTIRIGIQKVLSDGKQGISSQIPSSLKGTSDDPVMQESSCLPEMILVKAGDVEQNPGPFDRSANIQEQELLNLAYDVPPSKYTDLCIGLGVSYNQSQTFLDRHLMDFTRSLNAVFFEWKDRQRDGTDCRQVITATLRGVNLDALGDKMSRGGYLPQEAAPTASVASEKDHLTTEQVTRCADDFKTFYRTRLCKIKTDPLDFSLVLEFEKIYTDLVLLRNEQGTTKKIPLDYKELLKTMINGELPKRLMVEGEGGAGKTTFCSKMAWDWTNGADDFQEFVWVLVIPLRDIERNQTVGDIAKKYLSDSNSVQPHQIDEYILANPSKVFIIFDGLDEHDDDVVKQENDIAKIIRSEKFKECRVLVTTRPWKADQIKSNANLRRTYTFIGVAGFDQKHISIYINKYFSDDSQASRDLIKLIEDNDVIKENMAPFPIYIAMLCILWRDSDSKKRELICRLKTFSQLFQEIIISLKDHYVSKKVTDLDTETVTQSYEQLGLFFTQIGKIALSGVMDKKLVYAKKDFSSCKEAMETCCRVGVLSQENRLVPRQDRHQNMTIPVTVSVFFPHKLFQEYLAGMYLDSRFESEHEQYEKAMNDVIQRAAEFRYLLYFTASQTKKVAMDISNRLINRNYNMNTNFLVDVTFEAYDEDAVKLVGQHIFAKQKSLQIDHLMSAHTVSGYFHIMDKITMETLKLSRRSWGPTVSRDLADVICSSTSLTALELDGTALYDNFYDTLENKVKMSKVERLTLISMKIPEEHASRGRDMARFVNNLPRLRDLTLQDNRFDGWFYSELASAACSTEVGSSGHSIRKLHLDHQCHNDILHYGISVERLFPMLEHLYFTTLQTVSPNIVGSFAHSGLKELSFTTENRHGKTKDDEECHVPLIGDPSSLEQVFQDSFPLLTNLSFNNLVIGNNRCKIILSSLKQHQHFKNLCVIHCFTDEELDPIVSAINMEHRMKVNIQHDQAQKRLKCLKMSSSLADALCHRTSIQELDLVHKTIFSDVWFSEENQRASDSKIKKLFLENLDFKNKDPTASHNLARFLCLQPCLTDLTIKNCQQLHDDFYHEIAHSASSFKIQKLFLENWDPKNKDPTASHNLARFLCLQPCLTDLTIKNHYKCQQLHDDFYHDIAQSASSLKIQKLSLDNWDLKYNDPTASHNLARFLCLQPCLTDLTIKNRNLGLQLHDDFYHEIARSASSLKIQKLFLENWDLKFNDPTASLDLARFLCLQPCLTDLTMQTHHRCLQLHDDFYHEIARLASSFKIQKLVLENWDLEFNDPTASHDLARFLCLQPCLTDLTIKNHRGLHLHDDFYHEIARLASSFKIQKLFLENWDLEDNDPTASRDLASFICLQPCLTYLTISNCHGCIWLHDDFYHEIARSASSSKIQKLVLENWNLKNKDPTYSRGLAKFLCLNQSGLTNLTISNNRGLLHDSFYHEIARSASSLKEVQSIFTMTALVHPGTIPRLCSRTKPGIVTTL